MRVTRVQLGQAARSRAGGYSLVEVLAALLVVGIVLPVAMQGISLAASLGSQAQRRREATGLAQMKLQELVVTGAWQQGSLAGDFAELGPGYQWQAVVEDWQEESIRQLSVQVQWSQRGKEQMVMLTTLVDAGTY
ncbi:MAG: type II secretion system protein [Phycisphaerales bacterium]|nr:type II secretion system protein [Phycisphaerales bacterium]